MDGLILPGIALHNSPPISRPGTAGTNESSKNLNLSLGVIVKTYARACMPSDTRSLGNSENSRVLKRFLSNAGDERISFIDDGETMSDELTVGTAQLSSKKIYVNTKYSDKALPGFIRLAPDAPKHESARRGEKMLKESVNDGAIVHSIHTVRAARLGLRRSTSNLVMDEHRRATSPVSFYRERNHIEGFREPPRDYLKTLSPIDQKLALKKYGYGSSPKKKGEMLEKTILERYSGTDLLHAQNNKADILKSGGNLDWKNEGNVITVEEKAKDASVEFQTLDNLFETSLNDLSLSNGLADNLGRISSQTSQAASLVPPGIIVEIDDKPNNKTDENFVLTLESVFEDVNPDVRPGPASKKLDADSISQYSVPSSSQQSTGLPLAKGGGNVVKSKHNTKISPAVRRRMKIQAERAKAGGPDGRKPAVVKQTSESRLNNIKLRNPTERSIYSADPRPGALPPALEPFYDPATFRQPMSLEDRLRNIADDGDSEMQSFGSLDEYSTDASAVSNAVPGMTVGRGAEHAWRKQLLVKKIRFPDSLDSDSDTDNAFGVADEPDNFDFNAELDMNVEVENSDVAERAVTPEGMRREIVSEAKEAVLDVNGNVLEPAREAVYKLLPASSVGSANLGSTSRSEAGSANNSVNGTPSVGSADNLNANNTTLAPAKDYESLVLMQDVPFPGAEPEQSVGVVKALSLDVAPSAESDIGVALNAPNSPEGRDSTTAGLDASITLVRATIDIPELPPALTSRQNSLLESSVSHKVSQISDETSEIADLVSVSLSASSSAHRHSVQNAADLEEQRKQKKREAYRAKMRAKKLRELEEEEAAKQALFIANHVDPRTAKRVDYKFPDHGIQEPGVGEAYIQYRDYPDHSMFIGTGGAVMSQRDPMKSTLLDTILMDVRLRSPVYGDANARPISPSQRENIMSRMHQDTMFQLTMSGAPPPEEDISHRKLQHQIVLLTEKIRQNVDLSTGPLLSYGKFPDTEEEAIPASQRFRMEAEEMRLKQEAIIISKTQAKLDKKAEKDRAALAAAGIKVPRRKKLQPVQQKATAEIIPIAYAVGSTHGGQVGCSVVSTHPPSLVHKAMKRYTKEIKPSDDLLEHNLIPSSQRKKGSPIRPPQIRISKGVVVFTRDNKALDPDGGLPTDTHHFLWTEESSSNKDRSDLSRMLDRGREIKSKQQSRANSPEAGVDGKGSIASRGSVTETSSKLNGENGSVGSAGSHGARQPKPSSALAAESVISLQSGV